LKERVVGCHEKISGQSNRSAENAEDTKHFGRDRA
jgi:hypothetical protein